MDSIPKYLFIKRKKYFFKTVYLFYNSNIVDINREKDYSDEEPYLSIVINKFSKLSPINIIDKNNIFIGKIVYLDKIKEWHFIHRGKRMIIKYTDLENDYIRSLYVILTNNIVDENFLRLYYKSIVKIVKSRKVNDIKYILNNLKEFNNTLSIKTYADYNPNKEDICTICFNKKNKSKKIILPCKHTFHLECFHQWYKHKRICPLCKFEIKLNSFLAEKDCSLYPAKLRIYSNKHSLFFFPFLLGRSSYKNIKLKSQSGDKFKFLKVNKNSFAVEYLNPIKKINAIVISIINFLY